MATLANTIDRGTLAARPATMPEGSLYFVTDTSTLYRSNGSAWDSVEASVSAAYTDEQVRDVMGTALVAGSNITLTVNDPGDTITIAAATGAFAQPVPTWASGRYYDISQVMPLNTSGTLVSVANRFYAVPLYVPNDCTVDRIGVYVSTGAAGLAQLSIYQMGTDGWPGARVLNAGTVDTTASGAKEITISQALTGGKWYYLTLLANAGPTLYGWSSVGGWTQPYGQPTLSNTAAQYPMFYTALTYGTPPDPFGSMSGATFVTNLIRLCVRKA